MAPPSDLVEILLRDHWRGAEPPVRTLHPDDEMLRRDLWNPELARVEYFHTGMLAARTLAPVLRWREHRRSGPLRVLDFAAGYGRVTRFLARLFPDADVRVAELEPAAVEFQRRVLGLGGFESAVDPEQVGAGNAGPAPDHRFDVVLVTSLFSHLPEATFGAWLTRIARFLAPDGVLAFSVLDEAVLPDVFSMPLSGLFFEPASELEHRIEARHYGRSWVTETFVRERLETALPSAHPPCRVPRALWHYQDLWLASANDPLDRLAAEIDGGPDGRISAASLGPAGELLLEGWAVHPTRPDREVRVEVELDGRRVAKARPEVRRSDVARHFGSAEEWLSGWRLKVETPEGGLPLHTRVLVKAIDAEGLDQVLHLGSLESLLADQRMRELEAELSSCRRRLAEMEGEARMHREELDRTDDRGRWRRRWIHLKQRFSR